ncbi:hypothetical protein [Breoghania corrubedonensis]|nr:hypothetical protein [Breoghania corrubedonensis]
MSGSSRARLTSLCAAAALATGLAAIGPAIAADGQITLELNGASTVGSACQATLVARNGFDKALSDFGLDIVVFDAAGGVSDMSALSLGAMPAGKTRVLRFNIAKRACDKVSAVLVNDVRTCKGEGVDPASCLANLKTSSRIDIGLSL